MSRLGGDVLGVDPLAENIEVALHHASKDPSLHSLSYKCTTVEDLCLDHSNCFDLVVASEVLEHVERPDVFIRSCCHLVKVKPSQIPYSYKTHANSTLLKTSGNETQSFLF